MQNPVNSGVVNTSQRGIQRNIKHRRKTLHGRCPRLRVTTENIWCDLSVFRFLPVTMFRALYGYIHLNSIESLVRSDMIEHHIIAGEHVQKAYLNRRSQQMAVLNACLALKGASHVVLLASWLMVSSSMHRDGERCQVMIACIMHPTAQRGWLCVYK